MAKCNVLLSMQTTKVEIDLEDYGFESYTKWADLTEDEQTDIMDRVRNDYIIYVSVDDLE